MPYDRNYRAAQGRSADIRDQKIVAVRNREPVPLQREIEVRAFDLVPGTAVARHAHDWGQLTYAAEGVLTVMTDQGSWVAPPERAVWIPPNTPHEIRTAEGAKFRSFNVARHLVGGLPENCKVIRVSPLLRELLLTAASFPKEYDQDGPAGRLIAVLMDQVEVAESVDLHLPIPTDPRLSTVTDALLANPGDTRTLSAFSRQSGASERTLARLFLAETGLTFREWRRQRRLVAALERLSAGQPVTTVAIDLGYDSPSAFIAMFREAVGRTPAEWRMRSRKASHT